MSQTGQTPSQNRIADLKVSGHLMTLDSGLFCVFLAPSAEPRSASGLPGVRLTPAPVATDNVSIVTFDSTGWLGGDNNAALIRVTGAVAQVMVTIYQEPNSAREAPRLQVVKLGEAGAARPAVPVAPQAGAAQPQPGAPAALPAAPGFMPEIAAHIQRRGDVGVRLGDWMGIPGSNAWIEGFAIKPESRISEEDIEYQAVLGKGWVSPWYPGGQYCGSRGMALPILGLRVRLKGEAAEKYTCTVEASFTDGSSVGPVDDTMVAEAESLAPLEAFRVRIRAIGEESDDDMPAAQEDAAPAAAAVERKVAARVVKGTPAKAAPAKPAAAKSVAVSKLPAKAPAKEPAENKTEARVAARKPAPARRSGITRR